MADYSLTCPYCHHKGMMKAGFSFSNHGERQQRYRCKNKPCATITVKPIRGKQLELVGGAK